MDELRAEEEGRRWEKGEGKRRKRTKKAGKVGRRTSRRTEGEDGFAASRRYSQDYKRYDAPNRDGVDYRGD